MRPDLKARLTLSLAAAAACCVPFVASAQAPVDNRVGQVDNRVGGELYGRQNSTGSYPVGQYRLLPSEERNAIVRSGMLPSEYRANQNAVGPLPPNGVINYITPRSPLQRAMNLPDPQIINPGYQLGGGQGQPGQRLDSWRESPPAGYPQTLQAGAAASARIPGVTVNRPTVTRADLQVQPQPQGSPLPPIQLGPIETEEPTRGPSSTPRPIQPPPPTTTRTAPSESGAPPRRVVPSLTGAPDWPLPIDAPPPATASGTLLAK